MAKKRSRKKSYLKRVSRRTMRRTIRCISRRKIKKTRKKNKRGGAKTVGLTGLTPRDAELVSGGKYLKPTKNLFGDSRSVNVLNTLYGGDPEVINQTLLDYKNALELAWEEKTNGGDEPGPAADNEVSASFFGPDKDFISDFIKSRKINIPKFNIPKYILISGHGGIRNCETIRSSKCFTLLPRGFKLILATETGQPLSVSAGWIRAGDIETQINPSYYRMYEGLIPNHDISFDLIYTVNSDETPGKYGRMRDYGDYEEEKMRQAEIYRTSLYRDTGGQYNKLRIELCNEYDEDAADDDKYCASASLPGVNIKTVASSYDEDTSLNIFSNFRSEHIDDIPYSLAVNFQKGECGEDVMNKYSNKFVENLEELTDDNKEHLKTDAIVNLSILPKETIKNLIKTRDTMSLAQIFKHIEKIKNEKYENIPQVIVGSFCRSGDFNYNIDGLLSNCKIPDLGELRSEYFSGDINYEDVSGELRREISLASKTKPQDFWSIIYDNINPSIDKFSESVRQKFVNVKQKIEIESEEPKDFVSGLYKGINLSVDDVCLIFQMDQHLILNKE